MAEVAEQMTENAELQLSELEMVQVCPLTFRSSINSILMYHLVILCKIIFVNDIVSIYMYIYI